VLEIAFPASVLLETSAPPSLCLKSAPL